MSATVLRAFQKALTGTVQAASARDAKGEYLTYEALAHNVGLMMYALRRIVLRAALSNA